MKQPINKMPKTEKQIMLLAEECIKEYNNENTMLFGLRLAMLTVAARNAIRKLNKLRRKQ